MKNGSGRRVFLKNLGVGGMAAFLPVGKLSADKPAVKESDALTTQGAVTDKRKYNSVYTGQYLNRIAFPIGGMGAGMVCMEGTGAISQVSTRHQPDLFNAPGMFAAIAVKGVPNGAKLLEGPVPDWKKFGLPDSGLGLGGSTIGLPHFQSAGFKNEFPFCRLELTDKDIPLAVELTGWSPFIPTDEDNSGLPAGAVEYKFTNKGSSAIDAVFSFNSNNFLRWDEGKDAILSTKNGFILSEQGTKDKPFPSQFAVYTNDDHTVVDHCWFRGGWFDPVTMAWNTVKQGGVKSNPPVESGSPGASLYVPFNLAPGKEKIIRLMMAWYTPDTGLTYGTAGPKKEGCDPAKGCCNSPGDIGLDKYDGDFNGKYYKPWYSKRFDSINAVVDYWTSNYDALRNKSAIFTQAFFSSSLPPEVIEAVSCNLSILKSPTVMRQYDGRFWCFEGSGDASGSCHGSCTHVWNYAQAVSHLFPALERSLRGTEFCENQAVNGHQTFRATLPIQPNTHDFYSAADGQLGGIMKVYREWRISGDSEWLKKIYPMVKTSIDFCISNWDPRRKGVIEEPHHNTYDIEFWGPDGMHSSFYIGALTAFSRMGRFLGKDVSEYEQLASAGKKTMENDLYDGEFFYQQIKVDGLNARNPATAKSFGGEYSDEARALLVKEGPKYQYGKGCLSDGVLGAWLGRMCGLDDVIDPQKINSHLLAVHKYNLKQDLSEHANPQRPSFAVGDEGGLLLCSWPKGGKLSLPFVYSDEVWTGIEHQAASHLILMGNVNQGLEILRASRDRYDGRVRNPFNEYECGSWYARALASYGYLQAFTGIRYDAVDSTLFIDSKIGDFTGFISAETGFGTVSLAGGKPSLNVVYGAINVKKVIVSGKEADLQRG